jgi:hypothetical protein
VLPQPPHSLLIDSVPFAPQRIVSTPVAKAGTTTRNLVQALAQLFVLLHAFWWTSIRVAGAADVTHGATASQGDTALLQALHGLATLLRR